MHKKKVIALIIILILSITFIGAVTNYFKFKSERTNFTKKEIFEFDFSTSIGDVEIGPGDSVNISPFVKSNASLSMYVFIRVQMPNTTLGPLYTINPNEGWLLVEEDESYLTYAYVIDNSTMSVLSPEESTNALVNKMTMKNIPLSEYAGLDDINVSFVAYTIASDNVPINPVNAWNYLKGICSL